MVAVAATMVVITKAIGLKSFHLVSWSWGGALVQTFITKYPDMIRRAVLIGTNPPGDVEHAMCGDWFQLALKPVNDLADEKVLFFEPAYEESMAAAVAPHDCIYARGDGSHSIDDGGVQALLRGGSQIP